MSRLSNANAEIYYEASTNKFTYKGAILDGESMKIDTDYYDPVWVLVIPTNNNAYTEINALASGGTSPSLYPPL